MFSTTYDKEAKLWSGRNIPPLYNPNISIGHALINAMHIFGPKVAQINDDNGIQITYDEMKIKTMRAVQNLQARGIKPGQIVEIVARNSHHLAPIVFASIALGCTFNALSTSSARNDIIHMLRITKPAVMFCDVENYELVKDCLAELGNKAIMFTFGGSVDGSELVENLFTKTHKENQFMPVNVDGLNDIAVILCTSGSTAPSKGVCLSHAGLLDAATKWSQTKSSDVTLCSSQIHWISGLLMLLNGTLSGVTRIITTEPFSPASTLRIIEQYRVTFLLNVTFQLTMIMKCDQFDKTDLSSIRYVGVGGSKVPLYLKNEMMRHIPQAKVVTGYGMSEIPTVLIVADDPPTKAKDNTGRIVDGLRVKIVDDHGNRCGVNEEGEICIKTYYYQFPGYYKHPKATEDALDEEGFIKTGDIGYFDEDGDLFMVDRKKDFIRYQAFSVSPSAIDAFLIKSPEIKSACAVAIPSAMGDLPGAVIVRAKGSSISERDVFDMVADRFPDYYKLRGGVYFVDSLPLTPSGKVQRRQVRQQAIALYNISQA